MIRHASPGYKVCRTSIDASTRLVFAPLSYPATTAFNAEPMRGLVDAQWLAEHEPQHLSCLRVLATASQHNTANNHPSRNSTLDYASDWRRAVRRE